jgi:hypothetical protein
MPNCGLVRNVHMHSLVTNRTSHLLCSAADYMAMLHANMEQIRQRMRIGVQCSLAKLGRCTQGKRGACGRISFPSHSRQMCSSLVGGHVVRPEFSPYSLFLMIFMATSLAQATRYMANYAPVQSPPGKRPLSATIRVKNCAITCGRLSVPSFR